MLHSHGSLYVLPLPLCPGLLASSPSARPLVPGTLLGLLEAPGSEEGKLMAHREQGLHEEWERVAGLLSLTCCAAWATPSPSLAGRPASRLDSISPPAQACV